MLKLIATGLWVCIVTLAAVWFSISQATKPPESADAAKAKVDTEVVKVETISIPVISKGGVKGYFLNGFTFFFFCPLGCRHFINALLLISFLFFFNPGKPSF